MQTRLDLFVLKRLINMSYWVAQYCENAAIDLRRLNVNFQKSLVKELNFKTELANLERTRNNFRYYDDLYMPQAGKYAFKCSPRTMVMEFVKGTRIDNIEELKSKFGEEGPLKAADILVDVFAKMIFMHGFVHCDAHPGNLMVREHPTKKGQPQIVLLDHGFYCTLKNDFRKDFCSMWMAITNFDHSGLQRVASKMGMGQYFRYLPLLFTGRTINSKKPLGGNITEDEKAFIKGNDEVNFDKISHLF